MIFHERSSLILYIIFYAVISELVLVEHNINKEKSSTSIEIFFKQINKKRNFLSREKDL